MLSQQLEISMSKTIKNKQQKPATRSQKAKPAATASNKTKFAKTVAADPSSVSARENSKIANMITLLRRAEGATLEQLVKVTGWQVHSVRGAMSGSLKKKLGLVLTSSKTDKVRIYRIVG
jgi:hypothetical protein